MEREGEAYSRPVYASPWPDMLHALFWGAAITAYVWAIT